MPEKLTFVGVQFPAAGCGIFNKKIERYPAVCREEVYFIIKLTTWPTI